MSEYSRNENHTFYLLTNETDFSKLWSAQGNNSLSFNSCSFHTFTMWKQQQKTGTVTWSMNQPCHWHIKKPYYSPAGILLGFSKDLHAVSSSAIRNTGVMHLPRIMTQSKGWWHIQPDNPESWWSTHECWKYPTEAFKDGSKSGVAINELFAYCCQHHHLKSSCCTESNSSVQGQSTAAVLHPSQSMWGMRQGGKEKKKKKRGGSGCVGFVLLFCGQCNPHSSPARVLRQQVSSTQC